MNDVQQAAKLVLERRGDSVLLQILCDDEYSAMLLYDDLCKQAARGRFALSIVTDPAGPLIDCGKG